MIEYKQGDSAPNLVVLLRTEAGYTLSGKTVVATLVKPDATVVTRDVTVLDSTTRKVEVEWETTDFEDAGEYQLEFVITSAGKERTIPASGYFTILVNASL